MVAAREQERVAQEPIAPPEPAPFVPIPVRPRFFQASAFFPMPVVLLATRNADGAVNLAPYSLCFPQVTADGHRMVLVTRSASKTAANLARTGQVAINFIPDRADYLANVKLLSAAVPTAEKMAHSIFTPVPSARDAGADGTAAPPLVREAVQVFECRLVSRDEGTDPTELRFVLDVEAVQMSPYWAKVLEAGGQGPRLPVDYGFRRASESWLSRPTVKTFGPRLRPRFEVTADRPPEQVLADFRAALARPDAPIVGKIRGENLQLGLPPAEVTTWSPSLDLHVEPHGTGAIVRGRVGPQPQVWTTFMFLHLFIALCGLSGLMWGIGAALAGESAWPCWIALAAAFLNAFVAGAAFIGQGLGADQTHELRSFVDDVLGA
ncbi:MAG: flavin reductase [Myxococcales bacterium]|nr:flavin reductase [Myxococcales bacterium]MCB9735971.1 flavin reductase [Deltaproteobacteria bacterium]